MISSTSSLLETKNSMASKVKNRPVIGGIQHKECTKCYEVKPLGDFFNCKKSLFGKTSKCKSCIKGLSEPKRDQKRDYDRQRRLENQDAIRRYDRYRYRRDKEKRTALAKRWARKNPEKRRAICRKYEHKNKGKYVFYSRSKQMRRCQATPKWLTPEQLDQIEMLYILADSFTRITGIKHHVDHIHPIKGNGVRGLHVPWNLQILSQSENCSKSNKFDGTFENLTWRQEL